MITYDEVPPTATDPDEWLERRAAARQAGWLPIDLASIVAGAIRRPQPTVGTGPNGGGLLYPGRRHAVVAESEAGKTWLALRQAQAEAARGHHVLVVDFEDDEHGFADRALAVGIPTNDLDRLHYFRPEAPLGAQLGPIVGEMLGDWAPTLAVVDGVTDGMGLYGLDPLSNRDVADFSRRLLRPLTSTGAALVTLDHVTKSSEGRGRYALGGVHKLNDVNGAQLLLECRTPFGRGMTGRSGVFVGKDRPGYLRAQGRRSALGYWVGDLVGESLPGGALQLDLIPPPEKAERFRPTVLMDRIREALAAAPEPLTVRGILDRVTGKDEDIRRALACLIDDREVVAEPGPRNAIHHRLVSPSAP